MKNLKFLIDKLKKENTNTPFLLPPKNDDKITNEEISNINFNEIIDSGEKTIDKY